MTPVKSIPVVYAKHEEEVKRMMSEIQEFLDAGCDAAELWFCPTMDGGVNRDYYLRAARRLGLGCHVVEFHVRRGHIFVELGPKGKIMRDKKVKE